jgi:hypothetical protein
MTAKLLLLAALVWFGAGIVWSRFGISFFFGTGHGKSGKIVACVLIYLIQVVMWGWIAPLTLGVYLLFKH